jgi:hypothetical protein
MRQNGRESKDVPARKRDGTVAFLHHLDLPALRLEWSRLFCRKTPAGRCLDLLRRGIAWRLQANGQTGLSASARLQLTRVTAAVARNPDYPAGPSLKAGTVLVRQWKGVPQEVRVLEHGFTYQGRQYRSLSEIARLITGTRWNGPLFFGLKKIEPKGRGRR